MRLLRIFIITLACFLETGYVLAQADFYASATEGCTDFKVKFAIDPSSINLNTIISAKWYFGFGDTIYDADPDTITFTEEGNYTVVLIINNNAATAIAKEDYITVHRTLNADFGYEEFQDGSSFRFIPSDIITDENASYLYAWQYFDANGNTILEHDKTVTISNPLFAIDTFNAIAGSTLIMLTITDSYGCESSSDYLLTVNAEIAVPNVFAPDAYPFFEIDPPELSTILNFQVFNRHGLLIFKQEAPHIAWDGKTNTGDEIGTGVYFYILEAVAGDPNNRYTQQGFIHLFR